jgi:hypothetical protein
MGQSRRFDCVPPTSALPPSTDIVRSARQVRFVPTAEVTQVFGSTRRRGRTRLRSKACPRNEAQNDVPYFKLKKSVKPPAAEVATAVRTLAIMLDFRRRNDGPIAVTADFAGNPITVFNLRFCWRTVLVVATWHGAIVWHHPGGIKPLMDGLILRWMVMLLRYGGAGGENEAAPGDTNNRTHNTGGEIPASHGGPAKNTRNPMPGTLAPCESKATPNINNRPARAQMRSLWWVIRVGLTGPRRRPLYPL